jgi:hypothetical protein
MRSDHRWFVAVLLYQSRVGDWDDEPIVDHQVRLITAESADGAYDRALQLGEAHEHSYLNSGGERVSWDFLGLSELDELSTAAPKDGDEIFSWRTSGAGREFVKAKGDLSIFANARHANKTARELLDE